jgi:LacI family transcriptional regulator
MCELKVGSRRWNICHYCLPPEAPTPLVCCNDLTVFSVLNAAYRHKIAVSDDLSVIGFDDLTIASYAVPPLTTVRQPKARRGASRDGDRL